MIPQVSTALSAFVLFLSAAVTPLRSDGGYPSGSRYRSSTFTSRWLGETGLAADDSAAFVFSFFDFVGVRNQRYGKKTASNQLPD